MPYPPAIRIEDLVDRYDGLLLDAFGVLVDSSGPLRSGERLIAALTEADKPFFVVTNDASRLPTTASRRFRKLGLRIPRDRVLSSGSLIPEHFEAHNLQGATARVLGPEDSQEYVRQAGGHVLPLDSETLPEVVVICDETGFPFLETIDHTLSLLYRALDADRLPHLVLANPDLHYPHGHQSWGFTAGSIALLLETALDQRFPPGHAPRFHRLGKPGPELLQNAMQHMPTGHAAMVGDRLETDIAAAKAAGIDSVLIGKLLPSIHIRPTYLLSSSP